MNHRVPMMNLTNKLRQIVHFSVFNRALVDENSLFNVVIYVTRL